MTAIPPVHLLQHVPVWVLLAVAHVRDELPDQGYVEELTRLALAGQHKELAILILVPPEKCQLVYQFTGRTWQRRARTKEVSTRALSEVLARRESFSESQVALLELAFSAKRGNSRIELLCAVAKGVSGRFASHKTAMGPIRALLSNTLQPQRVWVGTEDYAFLQKLNRIHELGLQRRRSELVAANILPTARSMLSSALRTYVYDITKAIQEATPRQNPLLLYALPDDLQLDDQQWLLLLNLLAQTEDSIAAVNAVMAT